MEKIKVAVNGYGVIGKRVADAVRQQDDMELMGVADVVTDYRIKTAAVLNIPVYAARPDDVDRMRAAGVPVSGTLHDLLRRVDVVADCTPRRVGATYWPLYEQAGVKMIFQGGESHALTEHSFVAQANYATALRRASTRVVSCNTTAIVRTLGAVKKAGLLARARGTLVRRASDPWESHLEGIMNTVVPEARIPSHQGPDARTVDPELDVMTIAVKGSHTNGHLHAWWMELARPADKAELLAAFQSAPRIAFIRMSDGVAALNSTLELMNDVGRPRGDLWEVALWEDVLTVDGREAYCVFQVHNQCIVIPETIDAIRALTGAESEGWRSIQKTDQTLGLKREFMPAAQALAA